MTDSESDHPTTPHPDLFLRGVPASWAAYLERLPSVPRSIEAIIARVPEQWRPRVWLEIHAAEYGSDLDTALARWWRAALQWVSPDELERHVQEVKAGKYRPLGEVFAAWEEHRAQFAALSDEEKAAHVEKIRAEQDRYAHERALPHATSNNSSN